MMCKISGFWNPGIWGERGGEEYETFLIKHFLKPILASSVTHISTALLIWSYQAYHGVYQLLNSQRWARATFFWVCNRNSATWRKHLCNRKSATFKEMLLRNRNSAISQLQFFLKSATSSPQLELFTSAVFGIFSAVEDIERILKGQ